MGAFSAIERRIATVAKQQLGLIRNDQLAAIGLSGAAVRKRSNAGRLYRVHHGVYSLAPPPLTRHQIWLAAVLACGPEALLSREPSAILQGFLQSGTLLPHVTVPDGAGRSREGITVHRSLVDTRDRRRVQGIPCTSADRVLVDLAPACDSIELETLLVAAESLGLVKRGRLGELVAEREGRPGMRRLADLLALEPGIARSWPEVHFLPVCFLAGVPHPLQNHPIPVAGEPRPLVVDFAWPEIGLVVELDSQRFHGDWASAMRDRERDQLLALAGWDCHRFVRGVVEEDPGGTAGRLRALHAMRIGLRHGGSDPAPRAAGA
ncbi:MAG: type IV toxin-antitoxin system AbiEi family antitoxin domain-containing protein [Solirubrobacterales bacterium]